MTPDPLHRRLFTGDLAIPFYLTLAKVLIHFYTNAFAGYGIFRDELYYLANAENLDIGYVDHPPLSIFILAVNRLLFGDSIFAIRLLPALSGGASVFVLGLMVKEMGGKKVAQFAACAVASLSPIFLGFNTIYSMNSFDILLWTLGFYTVVRLLNTQEQRYWIVLGFIVGLGALNKISMLWFGAAVAIGFLFVPERRWLKTRWPYLAGIIAFVLFLPYIIWNMMHDYAHLEFIHFASTVKYVSQTPVTFLSGQILIHNPVTLPLWLGGLFFLLFIGSVKPFRLLGVIFLVVVGILILNWHSKPEYLAAAFASVYAGGGLAIERLLQSSLLRVLRSAYLAFMIVAGVLLAPLAIPILPVETYIKYSAKLGVSGGTAEGIELQELPQFYSDMFGWENMAKTVAQVYNSLSPYEKSVCAIYGRNYGQAGAIDFFGPNLGLPKAISFHNNYAIWGPRGFTGKIVIAIGGDITDYDDRFESVTQAAVIRSEYAIPYENNLPIYVCRNIKELPEGFWMSNHVYR